MRGETLASTTCQILRREIAYALIPPGYRLKVGELSERFGVGLSPVREALNRLTQEGLVVLEDHKGFSVAPVSKDDLLELNRAYCWVSEIAVRDATVNGDASWEEGIVVHFHRMNKVPRFIDGLPNPGWDPGHHAFHASILAGCSSPRILAFAAHLYTQTYRYRLLATTMNLSLAEGHQQAHRSLMEVVLSRDGDAASRELTNHHTETCLDLYNNWDDVMQKTKV